MLASSVSSRVFVPLKPSVRSGDRDAVAAGGQYRFAVLCTGAAPWFSFFLANTPDAHSYTHLRMGFSL